MNRVVIAVVIGYLVTFATFLIWALLGSWSDAFWKFWLPYTVAILVGACVSNECHELYEKCQRRATRQAEEIESQTSW